MAYGQYGVTTMQSHYDFHSLGVLAFESIASIKSRYRWAQWPDSAVDGPPVSALDTSS